MFRILSFSVSLLIASTLIGQQTLPIQQDTTQLKGEIILSGSGFYHGNRIRNEFSNVLIFGGYITDEMKDASMKNAAYRSRNRFGGSFSSNIEYVNYDVNMFGKSDWGFMINAGYETFIGSQYTRDAFSLIFKGNAHVENDYANLTDLHFEQITYQKIGFGVVDKKSRSSISVNLVNGQSFNKFNLVNGEYRQSPETDSISLLLKGEYSSSTGKSFSNGLGFAFDADFRFEIPWMKTKKAWIQLKAQNIGVVFFNKSSQTYALDTMYRYSGFKMSQILDAGTVGSEEFSLMDSLNITPSSGSKAVWLPGFIQLAKIVDRANKAKFQTFFGLNIFTSITYLPQVFAGVHFQPIPAMALGAQVSYGGFGELRGGLYLDFKMKNFYIGIGTQDFYGAISKNGFGQSITGRMTWQIN